MISHPKKAAHFLLSQDLASSPPNEAIVSALLELGYKVDLFAPGGPFATRYCENRVSTISVEYRKSWLIKNAWSPRWRRYAVFSATSEDPWAVAGVLSFFYRRPFCALADEIKSGSYAGNATHSWKRLCQWAARRAQFSIVNDDARIDLLREYASTPQDQEIIVYPGCFRDPPQPGDRLALRKAWGIPDNALILAASGGFNISGGADWFIQALQEDVSLYAVVQPLNLDSLARFLLTRIEGQERCYVEKHRLEWHETWASAAAFDIGIAIYRNSAPQFQNMGISSNRLCMFLAMGVPVIGSRQASFEFLEKYECGLMVESYDEFVAAIAHIKRNLSTMKKNCLRCVSEYIMAEPRYRYLKQKLSAITI